MIDSTCLFGYKHFSDQANCGILIIDSNGVIVDVNPIACRLTGFNSKELVGKSVSDLLDPDDATLDPQETNQPGLGETVVRRHRIRKKTGGFLMMEVQSLKLDKTQVLVLIHDDALPQKAPHSSEEWYRQIVETSLEGILKIDINHRLTYVNKPMAGMLGYTMAEMVGKQIEDFISPEDLPDHEAMMKVRHLGESAFYERRFIRKDGTICWTKVAATSLLDEQGNFAGSFGMFTDYSEHKWYEEHLKNSEERLQTLINASPDIICFKDEGGRWMQANDGVLKLYGLEGVDYTGKTEFELADFTAPFFMDAFRNCQKSDDLAWEKGIPSRTTENIPDMNGKMHVFDVVKVPLYFPDGSRKGIVVFGRDITDIMQAEQALRESEEKYRQIAENTSDVIWMMNDQMKYTYISPSIYRQRGFTQEEFLSLKPEEAYPPETLKKVLEIYTTYFTLARKEKISRDYYITAELQHRCKDGSIRDSEVLISPLFDPQGNLVGAHGVSRDITERKSSEGKIALMIDFQSRLLKINHLKEIHELVIKTIHGLIGEGIVFTTNIDHQLEVGKIVSYVGLDIPRNRLTQTLGLDPLDMVFYLKDITEKELQLYRSGKFEEVPGGLHAVSTRRFPELVARATEKLLGIKKTYTIGFVYHELHLGGLIILARKDLSGFTDTIEMIVNQAAITMNRIKAEESLKEAEERFRLAFLTTPDSININELETGMYVEVNEGFCALTGYRREDVIGRTSTEINIWADTTDRERLLELLKKEGKVKNFEAPFRLSNGTISTGLMSASIIHLNGAPHIISITRDIEELKKAEREIIRAKEAAEEASRLKTAFLNNISHEVRTPMNAILGFTDLLQSEDLEKTEKERFFGIINSNAKQLLSIIDDVLEISRLDSGRIPLNPGTFSLHELMEDIHLSMRDLTNRKGLQFVFSMDDGGRTDQIIADKEKIRQVIVGLIENAVKFTSEGTVSFGYTKQKRKIEFYVRDTGIGIPPDEHEKIFERFYQVNQPPARDVRGTGLGLSIARGLADVMGGTIRIESYPGAGSVFFLDISYQEPVSTGVGTVVTKRYSLEAMTILIAEDEDTNYELLKILLSKKTKKVIRAINGAEVMAILGKDKPDLIVMDLKMPVMDGYEATRQAKVIYPDLPIIALTAYSQPEEERRALEAGCCAFISKPISNQELIETILRSIRS